MGLVLLFNINIKLIKTLQISPSAIGKIRQNIKVPKNILKSVGKYLYQKIVYLISRKFTKAINRMYPLTTGNGII